MMFVLKTKVKIADYRMDSIHSIKVNKTIHEYIEKCEIKIPATARLKQDGVFVSNNIDTAKQIKEGDKVIVDAGYNDEMKNEFIGFVSRVNFTTPCSIECEGYSWQLRNKSGMVKSWKETALKEVLQFITKGTDITLSKDIPDVPITPMYIKNQNGLEVLDWIKDKLFLTAYFIGSELYVGLQETTQLDKSVKYRLGWNTIKDNQLKFRHEDEVKIRVKAIYKTKEGKLENKEFGDKNGMMRTVAFGRVDDMKLLEDMALKKVKEFRYSGYEGKLTAFLQPYCQQGYKAILIDDKYKEREGDYILESVETTIGLNGGRRVIEIGKRVSKQK